VSREGGATGLETGTGWETGRRNTHTVGRFLQPGRAVGLGLWPRLLLRRRELRRTPRRPPERAPRRGRAVDRGSSGVRERRAGLAAVADTARAAALERGPLLPALHARLLLRRRELRRAPRRPLERAPRHGRAVDRGSRVRAARLGLDERVSCVGEVAGRAGWGRAAAPQLTFVAASSRRCCSAACKAARRATRAARRATRACCAACTTTAASPVRA